MRDAGQLLVDSGYEGDADALRQHLTRYAHAYSHSQTPETDETVSPDEISGAINSMFVVMDQIDRAHFVGLCTLVEIDPAVLLPEPVQVDSEPEPTEVPASRASIAFGGESEFRAEPVQRPAGNGSIGKPITSTV